MDRQKIEQIVSSFAELQLAIKEDTMGILYVLNGSAHPDLTPVLANSIAELTWDLQLLSGNAGIEPGPPPERLVDSQPKAGVIEADVEEAKAQNKTQRRRASKTFNYLILEGVNQREIWRPLVGQEELISLAQTMDKNAKKDSLVSMFNRWKNVKGWLTWKDPTDLKLTEKGNIQRKELLKYVSSQKQTELVKAAFKGAWSHDMTPS